MIEGGQVSRFQVEGSDKIILLALFEDMFYKVETKMVVVSTHKGKKMTGLVFDWVIRGTEYLPLQKVERLTMKTETKDGDGGEIT